MAIRDSTKIILFRVFSILMLLLIGIAVLLCIHYNRLAEGLIVLGSVTGFIAIQMSSKLTDMMYDNRLLNSLHGKLIFKSECECIYGSEHMLNAVVMHFENGCLIEKADNSIFIPYGKIQYCENKKGELCFSYLNENDNSIECHILSDNQLKIKMMMNKIIEKKAEERQENPDLSY